MNKFYHVGTLARREVTALLHTLVGPDEAEVREKVRLPLIEYLRSSVSLIKQYAWSFPAFKKRVTVTPQPCSLVCSASATSRPLAASSSAATAA